MIDKELIEHHILKYCLEDSDYLQLVTNSFNQEYFNIKTIGIVLNYVGNHYRQYQVIPPVDYLSEINGINQHDLTEILSDIAKIDFDYTTHKQSFIDKTNEYLKTQSIKQGLISAVAIVNQNKDISKIRDIIDKALSVDLNPVNNGLEIMGVKDFISRPHPEREVMIEPWLNTHQYVILSAKMGVGKTLFSLSLCYHLSTGTDFYKWTPSRRFKTLYIDGEMTWYDMDERLKTFNLADYPDLDEYMYIYSVLDNHTTIQPILTNPAFRKQIEDFCIQKGIELVVFDNKSSLTPGLEETKTREWGEINSWLLSLRSKGITPWLIAHKGKNTIGTRGDSSVQDNNDISIDLNSPSGVNPSGGDCEFNMSFLKGRKRFGNNMKFMYMKYSQNVDGKSTWIGKDITYEMNDMYICLALNDGIPQNKIAERYGLTGGAVSKKKDKLVKKLNYLDNNNKLTGNGELWTSDAAESYYEVEKPCLLGNVEVETQMETTET
jgi:hypothetical protein